jgi:AcrR family transcriptional regulator
MSQPLAWPRALDHCVLPTADLDVAAARLGALGFTVAPMGVHPFGTANHCIYFDDGAFLEMLAVADPTVATAAAAAGNVFVDHDRAFRQQVGEEGFSALVLQTADARRDHARFVSAGVSAGDVLDFSRAFIDPAGNRGEASFRLAFARYADAQDVLVFTCQRVGVPNVDRRALQRHENGAVGIVSVGLTGSGAAALEQVAEAFDRDAGTSTRPAVTTSVGAALESGPAVAGPTRLASIGFAVSDPGRTRSLLDAAGIGYAIADGRIAVPSAPGQGAIFTFEAIQ